MEIQRVSEGLATKLENYLFKNPVKNAVVIYCLRKNREESEFYLATSNSRIRGVLLLRKDLPNPFFG